MRMRRSRKTLAPLLTHLASKWAGAASQLALPRDATLRLFPMEATAASPHAGWGAEAGTRLAAELMPARSDAPAGVFRLKYGWTAPDVAARMPPQPAAQSLLAAPPASLAPPQATPGGLLSLLLENSQHGVSLCEHLVHSQPLAALHLRSAGP